MLNEAKRGNHYANNIKKKGKRKTPNFFGVFCFVIKLTIKTAKKDTAKYITLAEICKK